MFALRVPTATAAPSQTGRRRLGRALFGATLGTTLGGSPAVAQPAPDSLRLIHGFAPTSAIDLVCRTLAEQLHGQLAPNVSVEYKAGAAGRIAVTALRRTRVVPDHATMLVTPGSVLTMLPHADRQRIYDPFQDLEPVCTLARSAVALVAGRSLPGSLRSFDQFVAWCRWHPDAPPCGNAGVGSYPHLFAVLIEQQLRIELQHIPYRDEVPALRAVAGGEIPVAIASESNALPFIRAGLLRVLATSGPKRSRFLPSAPTFAESGHDKLAQREWIGVFMPAGSSDARVWANADAIGIALRETDLRDVLLRLSYDPDLSTPEALRETLRGDYEFWGPVVQSSGLPPTRS
ncbi:MAG: tripartite tricarboxylate transporter substrate-binding protein [Lautropia sp.]